LSALSPVTSRATELRNTFDRARAVPFSSGASEQSEDLLAIRVCRDAYALRVCEISGLVTDRKIVAFPTPIPELLGVAGIRGALVPVYSLAALLGYAAETEGTRWLALCGAEEPVALAFGDFEGYLRIALTQLHGVEQKDVPRTHVELVVRAMNTVRAVLDIPLLRKEIQERCGNNMSSKER
jgi:chemotaxis signal transduction protein